ncbi:MAG TPA: hypothetical protein VF461_24145 [Gemmatimonadaceae bacterium]
MKRIVYVALALAAAAIVYFANDAISGFLRTRSVAGAGALFLLLPLAAFLTRPVVVLAQRNQQQRAIGVVYALRTRKIGFIARSFGLWLASTLAIVVLVALLYREGQIAGAAAVSNWWYVVNLLSLLAHLAPGRFQLAAGQPVTVLVLGAPDAGKSTFIGVLPLDKTNAEWQFNAMPSTARLTAQLHARARGADEIQPLGEVPRSTLVGHRPWAPYAGVRPIPVDFVELRHFESARLPRKRAAIAICVPAAGGEEAIRHELQRHLQALRSAGLAGDGGKVRLPVAVLLSKADLSALTPGRATNALPKRTSELLDQNCRTWEAFAVTDRSGAPGDRGTQGFTPQGYSEAALWLVTSAA